MGVTMALPFLECMLPRRAWSAETTDPQRFVAFYVPNGIHMPAWNPTTAGADFDLPPLMAPLADLKSQLLVISGLKNAAAIASVPGDHARGTGSFLSCMPVLKTEGENIQNGISLDQRLAQALYTGAPLPSLELGSEGGGPTGDCDSGYSCAYSRNISWSGATTPVAKEVNPVEVFDRLFGGFDSTLTVEQVEQRRALKKNILDYVMADANSLRVKLGARDRQKLDEYMNSVYELDNKLQNLSLDDECIPGPRPAQPANAPEQIKLMCDVMVLAMQCDMTRIMSYMLGNAGSGRVHGFLGISEGHHYLSHHDNDPDKLQKIQQINLWEMEQLAYLLTKMDAIQEPTGSLLDNSLVLFSSECADGNSHHHFNLPVLLAGSGGGVIQPGRHIVFPENTPIANLFVSILQGFGVSDATFGMDGVGPLLGLK
jgi:hypothetical protein